MNFGPIYVQALFTKSIEGFPRHVRTNELDGNFL